MNDKINNKRRLKMKAQLLSLAAISMLAGGCTTSSQVQKEEDPQAKTAEVDKADFIAETALHDAVRAKDAELAKKLISDGAKIDLKDIYGYTPLHIAVRLKEFEISKLLIENGAAVNTVDNYKDTPLLDSTRNDYTEISKLLICSGAYRNVADAHDMTPLHNSVKNNNDILSEMLRSQDLGPYCKPQVEEVEEKIEETKAEPEKAPADVQEAPAFVGLYEALSEEFKDDFEPWNAELTKDELLFRFKNPSALFEVGKSELNEKFTNILSDFFPRYLKTLESYKDEIAEVRIEGHTSSEYKAAKNDEQRYALNKKLSQERADAVRDYSVAKGSLIEGIDAKWVEDTFKSYGMSYDNPILDESGIENASASRRVEFRIMKK